MTNSLSDIERFITLTGCDLGGGQRGLDVLGSCWRAFALRGAGTGRLFVPDWPAGVREEPVPALTPSLFVSTPTSFSFSKFCFPSVFAVPTWSAGSVFFSPSTPPLFLMHCWSPLVLSGNRLPICFSLSTSWLWFSVRLVEQEGTSWLFTSWRLSPGSARLGRFGWPLGFCMQRCEHKREPVSPFVYDPAKRVLLHWLHLEFKTINTDSDYISSIETKTSNNKHSLYVP